MEKLVTFAVAFACCAGAIILGVIALNVLIDLFGRYA